MPDFFDAYINLSSALQRLGHLSEALENCEKGVLIKPDQADGKVNRGNILKEMNLFNEALRTYDEAISVDPHNAEAFNNRGVILKELKYFDEALSSYDKAVWIKSDYAEAFNNRGIVFKEMRLFEKAMESYDQAIYLKPDYAEAFHNQSSVLRALARFDEALSNYDIALCINYQNAEVHYSRGTTLLLLKRFNEAMESFNQAIAIKENYAEAHKSRAHLFLLLGNFDKGWLGNEWRKRQKEAHGNRFFTEPLWLGDESLAGKTIFIYYEQGLGDTFQFCRYVPLLAKLGANILFEPQKALRKILSSLGGTFEIVSCDEKPIKFDFHCPLLSLPLAFQTNLTTVPIHDAYLAADPNLIEVWNRRVGEAGFKIGICWQGSNFGVDEGRSFPLRQFEVLADLPNIRLISLHKGTGESQLKDLPPEMVVETLGEDFDSGPDAFIDTAAVIMCCDLIITSDTSIAHLAGALGAKTWLVLKYVPDWRWMLDRDDSPWYPSIRLFRQRVSGDWKGTFNEIYLALASEIQLNKSTPVDLKGNLMVEAHRNLLETKIFESESTKFLTILNDTWVSRSIQAYGEWSYGEIEAMAQILKPDATVIEVGANIGSHTVFLARDICSKGKIIAFEPRRILFQILCANIALNGIQNVHAYQLGCGNVDEELREGEIDFTVPLNAGGLGLGTVKGQLEKIQIVKIDNVIDPSERVALIKADVEGFEYKVLLGAEDTIKRERPILYLENDRVDLSEKLLTYLAKIGYDVWWHKVPLFRENNMKKNKVNIFKGIGSFNILCFPKERSRSIGNLEKVTDPKTHPFKK